ncbi:hypothetical protein NPIL_52661 [Nephila pilipes]|uniref:Uncharacterized protein n=1 Tax=Nephila pilipes TaxID=299642 RepID=A0A8X6NWX7_NEPPI|nr:hypothetical protein NPIL_52661 [Nephila pilipes]
MDIVQLDPPVPTGLVLKRASSFTWNISVSKFIGQLNMKGKILNSVTYIQHGNKRDYWCWTRNSRSNRGIFDSTHHFSFREFEGGANLLRTWTKVSHLKMNR